VARSKSAQRRTAPAVIPVGALRSRTADQYTRFVKNFTS